MTGLVSRCARAALLIATLSFADATAQAAETTSFTPKQKSDIEQIVHDYLVENPEVLVKAMTALQEKQARQEADQAEKGLATQRDKIFNDPTSFVAGNPKGDVTIVEFFDYQCGYCKQSLSALLKLLESDKKIRVVLKEYPILSEQSVTASKAALASIPQGKYFQFHQALMAHRGALDDATIFKLAAGVGIDTKKLKADMTSAKIAKSIADNEALADALAIRGTPAFIIGNTLVGGAMSEAEMAALVAKARAAKK